MRYSLFMVALLATAAYAQDVATLVGQIPACAINCLTPAITAAGCTLTDYACQCGKGHDAILSGSATCISTGCSTDDVLKTQTVTTQICQVVASSGSGSGSGSSASAAAAPASSAAAAPASSAASQAATGATAIATAAGTASATSAAVVASSAAASVASVASSAAASVASSAAPAKATTNAAVGLQVQNVAVLGGAILAAMAL